MHLGSVSPLKRYKWTSYWFSASGLAFGYNALSGTYEDLVAAGVIVPTKVERVAIQNAASISGLLLTTDCAITEIKEKKETAGAGAGMDDMDY